jgi:hypothetical protein
MTATTTNTTNTMTPSTLTCVSIESTLRPASQWSPACYKHKAYFPASGAYAVHQTGEVLSNFSKGLTVELTQRVGKSAPHAFEFYSDSQTMYAEGGLWFDDLDLSDYDGVFSLPKEVCAMLRALGFNTEYAD